MDLQADLLLIGTAGGWAGSLKNSWLSWMSNRPWKHPITMSDFNGLVENVNRTPVEVMLRHILTDFPQRDFTDFLPMCQYAYNTAEHAALKASPYYASWGCHPRNPTMFRAKTSVCEFPAVEECVSHRGVGTNKQSCTKWKMLCYVPGAADHGGV